MREIVKIKNEHGVLSVRIPRTFIKQHNLGPRDYLIWDTDRYGLLRLKPIKGELKNELSGRTDRVVADKG